MDARLKYLSRARGDRADIDPPTSLQKVTLLVDAILPGPAVSISTVERPQGRDWFVKAGASGGDGTREKPFRDPFQALEKAEGGDTVHVAGGSYYGKLRSGKWKILIRNLTMLGGYEGDFSVRDPWQNPTRFILDENERAKGIPDGTVLASEENSDGLVLDGFIFDGATYNAYTQSDAIDLAKSPSAPLVELRGGRASITVRNCVFLNASGAAISISASSGNFENNVVLNTSGWSLKIQAEGPGPWSVRNKTLLFASDPTPRAGTGQSSADGTLFQLSGRAVTDVKSNIFAFADNFGVRSTIAQQNVSYDNNVFAGNLFNHLTDAQYLWADSSDWDRRAVGDSGFRSFRDNLLTLPKLPVDPTFGNAVLTRLFAIPSRVSADEWKRLAEQIGASARPEVAAEAVAPEPAAGPAAATPSGPSSLNDLLASLSSMKTQIKEIQTHKPVAAAEPIYCRAADWQKALALVEDGPAEQPGVHRLILSVAFSAPRHEANVEYRAITAQTIDVDHASLDYKAVELEVTEARSSAGNQSVFPNGMSDDSFVAYNVSTSGESTRTRIAILVRLDTAASKLLDRAVPTDRLRIRGTARVPLNPGALSIVVDSAEAVES